MSPSVRMVYIDKEEFLFTKEDRNGTNLFNPHRILTRISFLQFRSRMTTELKNPIPPQNCHRSVWRERGSKIVNKLLMEERLFVFWVDLFTNLRIYYSYFRQFLVGSVRSEYERRGSSMTWHTSVYHNKNPHVSVVSRCSQDESGVRPVPYSLKCVELHLDLKPSELRDSSPLFLVRSTGIYVTTSSRWRTWVLG